MADIAILDDEKILLNSLALELSDQGHRVEAFEKARPFLAYLASHQPDLVLLDLQLPDVHGLVVLKKINAAAPGLPCIIITAHGDVESAIQAMKLGAFDYINKPFDLDEMSLVISRALNEVRLVKEVEHHRKKALQKASLERFLGNSPAVRELLEMVQRLTRVDQTTVFLRGESGTGKDLLARAIHNLSARARRQFIEINCAAFPESLLESELFGYEKGAFTDAKARKTGLVELADGGTLFLDEIGDMPLSLQAKLLKFLETKTFRRVGGVNEITVDLLIISATNRNLEEAVAKGGFRQDLFYRLNVVPLTAPPLRDRGEDVILIAEHYLGHFARKFRKPAPRLSQKARKAFLEYSWPGNVRELKNLMERLVILCPDEVIDFDILPTVMRKGTPILPEGLPGQAGDRASLPDRLDQYEKLLIERALDRHGNVKSDAARHLGISRYSLLRRIKRLFNEDA